MKNSMLDRHNMLVATMEELRQEDMSPEQLDNVVRRADATAKVGNAIVGNARVVPDGQRLALEHGAAFDEKTVPMLTARKLD